MDPKHENLVSMRDNGRRAERRRKMFAGVSIFLQYELDALEGSQLCGTLSVSFNRRSQLNPVSALWS